MKHEQLMKSDWYQLFAYSLSALIISMLTWFRSQWHDSQSYLLRLNANLNREWMQRLTIESFRASLGPRGRCRRSRKRGPYV